MTPPLRRWVVAALIEAVGKRGDVEVIAIELLWEGLVGWDRDTEPLDSVQLNLPPEPRLSVDPKVPGPRNCLRSLPSPSNTPLDSPTSNPSGSSEETFRETGFVCLCGNPKFRKQTGFFEFRPHFKRGSSV